MLFKLYSIKDNVAEEYGPVFIAKNDGVAARNFNALVKQEHVRVEDYTLYCLGEFDNDKGEIIFPRGGYDYADGSVHGKQDFVRVEVDDNE